MRLIVIALSMALLLGCSYQPFQSDALLDKIEQQVTIPPYQSGDFTLALGEYDRYYAYDNWGNVLGIYIASGSETRPGSRKWVPLAELPIILDGGCGIVNIEFDLLSQKVVSTYCNGLA